MHESPVVCSFPHAFFNRHFISELVFAQPYKSCNIGPLHSFEEVFWGGLGTDDLWISLNRMITNRWWLFHSNNVRGKAKVLLIFVYSGRTLMFVSMHRCLTSFYPLFTDLVAHNGCMTHVKTDDKLNARLYPRSMFSELIPDQKYLTINQEVVHPSSPSLGCCHYPHPWQKAGSLERRLGRPGCLPPVSLTRAYKL